MIVASPGCQCTKGGANATKTAQEKKKEEEEKKKKERKPNFEIGQAQLQPTDDQQLQIYVKPGHWVSALIEARANNFDFSAELTTATSNNSGQPKLAEGTRFRVTGARPAALPVGQTKRFEATWFVPPGPTPFLDYRLRGRTGNEVIGASRPASLMPAHQFYLVVLADNPDRYAYLNLLDVSEAPVPNVFTDEDLRADYLRVVRPRLDNRIPLPAHPLEWTMISGIWWDNINPNLFSPDQQDAMLDWLHWGGNLVVSGPDTLEKLQGGFLDPYLPADPAGAVELGAEALAPLNASWSLDLPGKGKRTLDVLEKEPLVGVRLEPRAQGREIDGTGGLVVERQVGAGRIVVTGFSLKQRPLINWGSFDSFVNGCLLRRPPRRYQSGRTEIDDLTVAWADGSDLRDPRLISGLRLFSRDIGDGQNVSPPAGSPAPGKPSSLRIGPRNNTADRSDWRKRGYAASTLGVAGWSNRNAVSVAARDILEEAAGIRIPKADFVVSVLAVYLVVLVPVNWLFFRLLGRVELAWVTAPLIAIVGSIAVVKMAQLDIGFARSRTEAAILELYGGHRRGHLTRFTALYTSLSTSHDFEFVDPGALAMPFPTDPDRQLPIHESIYSAVIQRAGEATFSGFVVSSNSTERVRSEQLLPLEGPIQLQGDPEQGCTLENRSQFTLRDAWLLHRTFEGNLLAARLNDIAPKTARLIELAPPPAEAEPDGLDTLWNDVDAFYQETRPGSMSLRRWLQLAVNQLPILPGEFRLVAWSDQPMADLKISPSASQSLSRTLILAHLRPLILPACAPDRNLRAEFRDEPKPLSERELLNPAGAQTPEGGNP